MRTFLLPLFILGLLILSSCRETVVSTADINIPEKLVLGCFISPQDDTIRATLTLSRPIYGRRGTPWDWEFEQVPNAVVRLSDGINTATLVYSSSAEAYLLPASALPIVAGLTYTMTVEAPDGKRVQASCTVPTIQNFSPQMQAGIQGNVERFDWRIRVNASWQRLPGDERYFSFSTGYDFNNSNFGSDWLSNSSFSNFYSMRFYTDRDLVNGQFAHREEIFPGTFSPGVTRYAINGQLQEHDIHSYRYLSSLQAQDQTGIGGFSEPVVIYSNVVDGIGCFGALNSYTVLGDTLSINIVF
jgi:hypothetical protein